MKAKAHKIITTKVLSIFKQHTQGVFHKRVEKFSSDIVDGSVEADIFPIFERATNWHFYHENSTLAATKIGPVTVYPTSDHILSKRVEQLHGYIAKAKDATSTAKREDALEEAFELVGRALHHIQDMSTPSHITPIYHGPDFPFNQVEDALIISDDFENYTADQALLSRLLNQVTISKDEFEQLRTQAKTSLMDSYEDAAQTSLFTLFGDNAAGISGMIDGKASQIPCSMFWQRHAQSPADGKIKGFGSFGPLAEAFAEPGKAITVDGKSYQIAESALEAFCSTLINKMVRDSIRALFVVESMMDKVDAGAVELKIDSHAPVYGENYKKGYIGFTYQKDSVVSIGIAYITRWARISDVKVSHAFVVSGKNECVEAVGTGVRKGDLEHYFNDPHCQVFFRKPIPYDDDIAGRISSAASEHIGQEYDHSLIPAQAFQGSLAGRMLDKVTGGALERFIMNMMNSEDQWICSELAAYSLDSQPEYHDRGILNDPNETIDPQELFEDETIFKPWRNS